MRQEVPVRKRRDALVPVNFAGRTGHLYVHVVPGGTPFLCPRPLMEKFGLVIDFGQKRLQWSDGSWTQVRQTHQNGHYLLDLASDPRALRRELRQPTFVDIPDHLTGTESLLEIGESTGDFSQVPKDRGQNELQKPLQGGRVRSILYAIDKAAGQLTRDLKSSRKPLVRRRKCWEVFAGLGLVSHHLRQLGTEVHSFNLETGWDLSDTDAQRSFYQLMDSEAPDEIWLSAPCGPWSPVHSLNVHTMAGRRALDDKRRWHHDRLLAFTRVVFNNSGRKARTRRTPEDCSQLVHPGIRRTSCEVHCRRGPVHVRLDD